MGYVQHSQHIGLTGYSIKRFIRSVNRVGYDYMLTLTWAPMPSKSPAVFEGKLSTLTFCRRSQTFICLDALLYTDPVVCVAH